MAEHRGLLDSFADARRTWDDLVGLQPDVMAGSGNLKKADLVELERRVEAHRMAIDMLADVLEAEPPDTSAGRITSGQGSGISNRESASEEANERREHPPIKEADSPAVGKVPGAFGRQPEGSSERESHAGSKTRN